IVARMQATIAGRHPLVLASTSRYRAELLESLALRFEAVAPAIDERARAFGGLAPDALAMSLARAKAEAVRGARPDAVVIGSDQVCALGEQRFDKPGTSERAVATLEALQGRTHVLWTALVVAGPEGLHEHLDETRLTMASFDRRALERYVARDLPLDCAGAYKLERLGAALFERIETRDASAVVGLPRIALAAILRRLGWELP
ncbi:MAG: Maf family nucleotide pyrophosphatase, partial [Planctomycetota bacterium]